MATKKATEYKVHPLSIDDALDLAGILAAGGLAGQANAALGQISEGNTGAALSALSSLVMGALANHSTRDQMRGFLFSVWVAPEDKQATDEDLDIAGRLEPKYNGEEFDKESLYYKKLQRFHRLPPRALVDLFKVIYASEGFADFLELLRMEIPTNSSAQPSDLSDSPGLQSVK